MGSPFIISETRRQVRESRRQTLSEQERSLEELEKNVSSNISRLAASGVTLEGSPLFALEQSVQTGIENIADIGRAGRAQEKALIASGKQAVIGDIVGTAKSGASASG